MKYENPMTPEDDIYHKYYWLTGYHVVSTSSATNYPDNIIWEVTVSFKTGNQDMNYFRAPKNNVETKTSTTQTMETFDE